VICNQQTLNSLNKAIQINFYLNSITFLSKSKFEVHMCDFAGNSSGEVIKINDWVSGKTHKLIPTVLGQLSNDTKLVLVNTLYLKMDWLYKFKESYEHNFTKYNESIEKVKMMCGRKKSWN